SYALTATDVGGRTYGITRDATGAFDHTCSPSDQRGCRDGTW
ncbi:MAG: hypothetical protein QOG15_3572, partial [Solirubrobacteraceae bacterium]|nr:hypothetical protein [Solirubrobacteraceae bacterium]